MSTVEYSSAYQVTKREFYAHSSNCFHEKGRNEARNELIEKFNVNLKISIRVSIFILVSLVRRTHKKCATSFFVQTHFKTVI